MKFIILVIAFMLVALISYPQAAARRGFGQRPWTVNKEEFSSGDTLVFTLKITSREKLYYYLSPEYYTLYQIEGDDLILVDDTLRRKKEEPVRLRRGNQIIIKKAIKQSGSYLLSYPIYSEKPFNEENRSSMEQRFEVGVKRKKEN